MKTPKWLSFFLNDDAKIKKKRKWISAVLLMVLFLVLAFTLDWAEIWAVLKTVDPILIAISFSLFLPYHWLTAKSFKIVTDQHDFGLSIRRIMWVNLTILFYVITLPAALVGSGMRLYRFAKYSQKPVETFAAITYHKVYMNLMVILMSLCFLVLASVEQEQESLLLVCALLGTFLGILLLIPRFSTLLLQHVNPPENEANSLFALGWKYFLKILASFAEIGKMSFTSQIQLAVNSLAAKLVHLGAYFLITFSIGIQAPFNQLGMVFSLVFLANNLPFNFSLGIGLREISLGALLLTIGVDPAYAVAMPLVLFARAVFIGLVGSVLEGISLLKERE